MGRDFLGLVLLLLRHVEDVAQPLAVEREAVGLLEERAEHVEEVALDLDVAAHVGLAERQLRRLQELLLRDILVHDHRELRLTLANRVHLIVQLHIEAVLVKVIEIVKQEIIHGFLEMHQKNLPSAGSHLMWLSQVFQESSTSCKQNPLLSKRSGKKDPHAAFCSCNSERREKDSESTASRAMTTTAIRSSASASTTAMN